MALPSRVLSSGNSPLATISICGDGDPTVTALGTNLATAYQLSKVFNNVSSAAASTGVKLPVCEEGAFFMVYNTDSDTISVFPNTTAATINGTTSVTIAQDKCRIFFATSATTWFSMLGA